MTRGPDFVPKSFGRWTCLVCQADGIGGLNAFYMHWTHEHHTDEPATAKEAHVR